MKEITCCLRGQGFRLVRPGNGFAIRVSAVLAAKGERERSGGHFHAGDLHPVLGFPLGDVAQAAVGNVGGRHGINTERHFCLWLYLV